MINFSNFSNQQHRYSLEKGSKKHHCPDCNKKTFVLYIDTETGDYLPEHYGRCDRESNCSYHLNPYLDGYAKAVWEQEQGNRSELPNNWKPKRKKAIPQPTPEPVFFDFDTFKKTLELVRYEQNTFIQNLFDRVQYPFEVNEVTKVVQLYCLGTVAKGYRAGAITFPYIDINGNVRAIQVKQFDESNHTTGTDFLHSIIEKKLIIQNNKTLPVWLDAYNKQEKKVSCLFGEHLLNKYPNSPVALVEAPKTAIYGTLYFGLPEVPENFIWLAVYNKSSFSFDKLKVLQGRFVYVFPDLSKDGITFKEWENKAKEFESRLNGTRFIFSDILEKLAPENDKFKGYDIADYLIKQDWRTFRKEQTTKPEPEPKKVIEVTKVTTETKLYFSQDKPKDEIIKTDILQYSSENWNDEIKELENYFNSIELPANPVQLKQGTTIINCSLFVDSHLINTKSNNGNKTFLPYLNRLQELKQILTVN